MDALEQWLRGGVRVLDGALATELERRGFDLRDPLWSAKVLLERPEAVRAVHESYLAAGADVITTASYQATIQGFERRGLTRAEAREALLASVRLACEARDAYWERATHRLQRERPLVAASIGSYGAYLADGSEFRGDYALSEDELAGFHRERVAVLASSGADLLAFETIPKRVEARALAGLLREHSAARAWLSFSCRDAHHLSSGERLDDAARELDGEPQLVALGVNCTAPRWIESLVTDLARATHKPIVVYPNSGEAWDADSRSWSGVHDAVDLAREAPRWIAAGARLIGGCCRTTPAAIAALRASLSTSAPS